MTAKKKTKRCGLCGGTLKEVTIERHERFREEVGTVMFQNVPMLECRKCSERWLTPEVIKAMEAVLEGKVAPTGIVEIEVPAYDFALAAMELAAR